MDNLEETKSYTLQHISRVRKKISYFVSVLEQRAQDHDKSKIEEPEIIGWAAMDQEPKYEYGSPAYYDKMDRYKEVFDHHYAVNRHHPEFYHNPEQEMNLVDLIEMLCDWFSYKEEFTYEEGYRCISEQCKRFHFSHTLKKILLNTFKAFILKKTLEEEIVDMTEENYANVNDVILNIILHNKGLLYLPDYSEEKVETNLDFEDLTKVKFHKNELKSFCENNGVKY